MTKFLTLLADSNKEVGLRESCVALRSGRNDPRFFSVSPDSFYAVPGAPFAYWVSDHVRSLFAELPRFESDVCNAKQGLATAEDFRFLRLWWESSGEQWYGFAKGGAFSPFYSDIYLIVNWNKSGSEIQHNLNEKGGIKSNIWMLKDTITNNFFRPGLTWPRRTKSRLSMRIMPAGCIFGDKGPAVSIKGNSENKIFSLLAISSSVAFHKLVEIQLAAGDTRAGGAAHSFEVGVIQKTPIPLLDNNQESRLASLAHRAWSLMQKLDTIYENSHAFILPKSLRTRLGDYDSDSINVEFEKIRKEIDTILFNLYEFTEVDRISSSGGKGEGISADAISIDNSEIEEDEVSEIDVSEVDSLISWAVGVAFGRFDWRLSTGERQVPPEPKPLDPLPTKSPGMLPDEAEPFHRHGGILVDDQGHPNDLPRLIEEVLIRVEMPVPDNIRRWIQKDFFAFHLQRYSKSRRKAPIYWPLSTTSGTYTLWIYYPSLNSQTLFTAVNDFLDGPNGKLTQVSRECAELRLKGSSRSSDDEKRYEMLQTFEQELTDLRDTLLKIAPTYQPNHDDGVQITAAPLWPLFRHKPWQKLLKDTWTKLEKGDYDWAHLAMNYWPERVREKCKTDKSLAIAHGLESIYVEPEVAPKKTRSKKKAGIKE
ncbi:type II restriction endonuclease subunit M [Acinetobacter baumannii]|uniref:Putative type II restriction enzyme, methylase subunit n=1 Tax=Acinetobacter baumannii 99063 TaxID=1310630 RepID=A0A009TJ73_ACIBA|nr:hypothetical protein [Acinetobacter baumannii]EXC51469.1 putative type II restriction enzyme, methylase subunit [Acinetobacter baumannii 99063]MBD0476867.1 type II restriction endonuclease subunit M [Acinetobacter baumannii]MCZ3131134.1 BREX-1 system adenine-specific DNA-methyltransferase PglX [Acinetobacter baumannii]MDC4440056.1 BREX-1 system adenine-specific DNA-methyltransferase PglX [Acinetobacter baumannii]MDI9725019.1 type II restriction endonuclease subunit M [Acinetobacter baumanni